MSARKRKATEQQMRPSPAMKFQRPVPRSRSTTLRKAPRLPQHNGVIMKAWNWLSGWICPPEDMQKVQKSIQGRVPSSDGELVTDGLEAASAEAHIQTSTRRSDGTVTMKRQKTQIGGGAARRPKSANDAVHVTSKTVHKGPIDFRDAHDEKQRAQILNAYWEPPQLGFFKKKMSQEAEVPSETSMEAIDESLSGLQLDAPRPPSSTSSSQSPPGQYGDSPFRKHIKQIPQTSGSISRLGFRPSKSTGNLKRNDFVKTFFEDEGETQSLKTSTRKVRQLEVLRRDRERRELQEKRQAAMQRRLIRQSPLRPLIQALDMNWNARINQILHYRNPDEELTKSLEGTELRVKDFQTLLGQQAWLNDEVINAYIEWITTAANNAAEAETKAAGEPVSTVPKFLAHSTFFYNILVKKGPSGAERLMKRKKAPGASLLEVDTVFIPICRGAHWTIALVRPIAKTIEYLDSMGGQGTDVISVLTKWVKHQLGSKYDASEWKFPRTSCAYQSNGYDCGVFVCTNALCVAIGVHPDCYSQRDLTQQRMNIAAVLLNRGFEGDFRWDTTVFVG
ncbi:related to Ubl-specific protease [Rhynchosporium agropyri]|uniref:Related to Ubl-specific protease n=1 Tax=Rhynchosporium agropyri TaxID=914238 RepID=A0A1E1JV99_9HELO|nr:related to Ubl-specific protease [Rhynchosporium agropyri]